MEKGHDKNSTPHYSTSKHTFVNLFNLFIHSTSVHAYYDPGTVLDARSTVVNKTDKNSCLHTSYIPMAIDRQAKEKKNTEMVSC